MTPVVNELRPAPDVDETLDRIFAAYERLGYPREVIGQWTLPRHDARRLLEVCGDASFPRILEVGTFVGLTTMLLALRGHDDTVIDTVDPNLPLDAEFQAMRSRGFDADLERRPHDLAREVAVALGVAERIRFHAGGFSTGETFASSNRDPGARVDVIGAAVCADHGPFDLVFVDGLHFTDAVLGDLRLAADHLAPGGLIVIHDVLGMWGSNVRRGVSSFLEDHPHFTFTHGRYDDVHDGIGLLRRHDETTARGTPAGLEPALVENIAAVVTNLVRPRSVIELGASDGALLRRLGEIGATETLAVPGPDGAEGLAPPITVVRDDDAVAGRRFDLCICVNPSDAFPGDAAAIVETCVAASDAILFAATPPGEMGIAPPNARPMAEWTRLFIARGYLVNDVVRPALEPLRSPLFAHTESVARTSRHLNLFLVRRDPRLDDAPSALLDLLVERERRIEDLSLQQLYDAAVIRHAEEIRRNTEADRDRVATEQHRLAERLDQTEQQLAEAESRRQPDVVPQADRPRLHALLTWLEKRRPGTK